MIPNERYMIKVPASSANLGPGFDSIGIAVDLFLSLEIEQAAEWSFHTENEELNQLPIGEDHFICQVAQKTANKFGGNLQPCKVKMDSEIPLARGLGSSAAAIIAGIELADLAAGLGLTKQEKLEIATEMEGHPDNVGASLYGGLVVGCYQQEQVDLLSFSNLQFELVALIPRKILLTKESRKVLPDVFSYSKAVQASATANLLVAALLSENWATAGKMMRLDHFHQPYRKPLIPFYQEAERGALHGGAFGVALSGAGPTLLCFAEEGQGKRLAQELQRAFPQMQAKLLQIEDRGSLVCKLEEAM